MKKNVRNMSLCSKRANIFFLSHAYIAYKGRTLELLKVARELGKLRGLVVGDELPTGFNNGIGLYPTSGSYAGFAREARRLASEQHIDVLFVDNRRAIPAAMYILGVCQPDAVVYDMRELSLLNEVSHLRGKLGCVFEQRFVPRADIVVCANEERAELVKKLFHARHTVCFENVRQLEYSPSVNLHLFDEKYKGIFPHDSLKIISTSGVSLKSGNGKLVESLSRINAKVDIYLVGHGTPADEKVIHALVEDGGYCNVHILGMVSIDELKYLVGHCDCGVVNYHCDDTNNRLCASGKLYEFVFEGKPVLTTSNPPLAHLTKRYGIGCSGDDYAMLIDDMADNYTKYEAATLSFRDSLSVERSRYELVEALLDYLGLV